MDSNFLTVQRKHRKDRRVKAIAYSSAVDEEVDLMKFESWLQGLVNTTSDAGTGSHDHGHGHDHSHDHSHDHDHEHTPQLQPTNLYRYKGIIAVKGMDQKLVFQGVGMVLGSYFSDTDAWTDVGEEGIQGEFQQRRPQPRHSQFVLIGKDLDREKILSDFQKCVVKGQLRFDVGTTVEANITYINGMKTKKSLESSLFMRGQVIATWDSGRPYRILLEDTGEEIWSPVDEDMCVRLAAS